MGLGRQADLEGKGGVCVSEQGAYARVEGP